MKYIIDEEDLPFDMRKHLDLIKIWCNEVKEE